jgi:hypothetical protein
MIHETNAVASLIILSRAVSDSVFSIKYEYPLLRTACLAWYRSVQTAAMNRYLLGPDTPISTLSVHLGIYEGG